MKLDPYYAKTMGIYELFKEQLGPDFTDPATS